MINHLCGFGYHFKKWFEIQLKKNGAASRGEHPSWDREDLHCWLAWHHFEQEFFKRSRTDRWLWPHVFKSFVGQHKELHSFLGRLIAFWLCNSVLHWHLCGFLHVPWQRTPPLNSKQQVSLSLYCNALCTSAFEAGNSSQTWDCHFPHVFLGDQANFMHELTSSRLFLKEHSVDVYARHTCTFQDCLQGTPPNPRTTGFAVTSDTNMW